MTDKEKIVSERLKNSVMKCNIHLQRLHYAVNQTHHNFPLSAETYALLNDSEVGNIDQMVYRFTKLQDEMGTNTFRFLLEFLQEDVYNKPFRDILNILERLLIIDSSDTWLTLRELRNDLAHEYPLMVSESIVKLNHLLVQIPVIEAILANIEQKMITEE
jgi:hypothetical protein